MDWEKLIISVVQYSDGWVIVAVVALYVALTIYRMHDARADTRALIAVLRNNIENLLVRLSADITRLTDKLDAYLLRQR